MTGVEVARRVRVTIAIALSVRMRDLADNVEFRRDLGADSLDLVTLPMALEEEFGIRFSDDEVEFTQTVGTAVDLVRSKLENRGVI